MRKSHRSQDKSIYLAFALSPSISFESLFGRQQSHDRRFLLTLSKENQTLQQTNLFSVGSMNKQCEMYLYLSLPHYAQKLHEKYFIRLVQDTEGQWEVVHEQAVDLGRYINEHNTLEKDFWTQIVQHSNQTQTFTIMQRVFLKRNRFELDDIINSSEMGQELDIVDIPVPSTKFSIDKRKSRSFQSPINSLISPRRLDTISEEDSLIPFTERKQRQSIGDSKPKKQPLSASVNIEIEEDFEHQLQKRSTWVEKNNHFDDEFVNAFEYKNYEEGYKHHARDDHFTHGEFDQLKLKSTTESEISQKGSKISKNTKDSQKQCEDNSLSFLDKSSLLSDMSESQTSISPDDEMCFKLKWVILAVVILVLAVVASLSTDAFDITDSMKQKIKVQKKKAAKSKQKQAKGHKSKQRHQVHT